MSIVEQIGAHRQALLRGEVTCGVRRCPLCHGDPGAFSLHERRRRGFWVVVERVVEKVVSLLARWKCPLCRGTFTEYPAFARPHKRYVASEIEGRSRNYMADEDATYQKAARDKAMAVCHPIESTTGRESHLCASTVWRWVGFLGKLKEAVRRAVRWVRQRDCRSAFPRSAYPVPARKYRSQARRQVLGRCLQLLALQDFLRRRFAVSIFPRSAIAASFT